MSPYEITSELGAGGMGDDVSLRSMNKSQKAGVRKKPVRQGCRLAWYPVHMPLSADDRVGPYEITGELDAGGMGIVLRARDTKLDRVSSAVTAREGTKC